MIDLSVSFKTGTLEYREAANADAMRAASQGGRWDDNREDGEIWTEPLRADGVVAIQVGH